MHEAKSFTNDDASQISNILHITLLLMGQRERHILLWFVNKYGLENLVYDLAQRSALCRSKGPHFSNLGNYVKFAAYYWNMLTNHKLHRKQNNGTVTTGVGININLHFVFSSVLVRELGQKTPDKWKTS